MPSSVDDTPRPASAQAEDHGARLEAAACWLDQALAGRPAPPLIAVIGLGDGELLDVLDQRAPASRVLALEPDPAVAARCLRRPDLSRRREAGALVYLVDPDYAGADEAWRAFPTGSDAHALIVSPAVARDPGPGAVRAARAFKDILFGVRANIEARRKFAPGYLAGTLHNLPEILAGQDVRALDGAYAGLPAIVLGAGPSLDDALGEVEDLREHGVIIAADTALRPLLVRGIAPQFAVAVDPQALNARHFHELPPCPDTWLVSEASIDPSVLQPFDRRTFWFRVANHEPWPWYNDAGIDVGRLDVWGSVLTAAFQVAVLAGCDPIVFAGADLAFTGGRPYCRGTTYEFDWAFDTAGGQTLEHAWRPFLRTDDQIRIPDVRGRETLSTPAMQSFRDWLVARVRRSGRRVVNATGGGILLGDGIEQSTLRDVLTARHSPRSPGALPRKPASRIGRSEAARRLWDLHRSVCRNEQATAPLDRWKEFCGDGFNLQAVGDAVERAAHALERPDSGPVAGPAALPVADLGASALARAVMPRLPEAMARLRQALAGSPIEAAGPDGVTVEARLVDACDLLHSICVTASGLPDLAVALPLDHIGRVPLGALYSWPVELTRAVRVFEALVGDAWSASPLPPPGEGSFFTRHVTPRDLGDASSRTASGVTDRPHLSHACACLALEWLLCVLHGTAADEPARRRVAAWWRGLVSAIFTPADGRATGDPVVLLVESGAAPSLELRLPVGEAALARALTGTVTIHGAGPARAASPLASVATPSRVARLSVHPGRSIARLARQSMARPRVLTDEGVARGVLPYASGGTAVCTILRGTGSIVVHEDGTTGPGFTWPRPTNGELPFGDGGAVAWSVGSARWPDGGPGIVMYRRAPHDEPTVETLPFGPQVGAWWRDRFYWACFPFGVGSWAPGLAPEFALPDRTLFSVLADDEGLVLGPRSRTRDGAAERRLITEGLRWRPGTDPQPLALGPHGVASSRCAAHGWTAVAHPEADVVELTRADGARVTMECYYPFGVAWAGRSLLVSTTDGELLHFEHVPETLDAWTGGAA